MEDKDINSASFVRSLEQTTGCKRGHSPRWTGSLTAFVAPRRDFKFQQTLVFLSVYFITRAFSIQKKELETDYCLPKALRQTEC